MDVVLRNRLARHGRLCRDWRHEVVEKESQEGRGGGGEAGRVGQVGLLRGGSSEGREGERRRARRGATKLKLGGMLEENVAIGPDERGSEVVLTEEKR